MSDYPPEAIVFEMGDYGQLVEFWDWDVLRHWIRVVYVGARDVYPHYVDKHQLKPLTPTAQAVWEVM